ncbi:hypothetical protein B0H15DRAFT_381740 [Mycena belliarum]|uniref:Uncharacterized protein n=1 Tax=Mycena belliarum TaxID=1033014 RepID=A0AAD6XMG8_9AGAR|nr:hypothetical protein B0H15DRAFT_381740 [Mycena belliae]
MAKLRVDPYWAAIHAASEPDAFPAEDRTDLQPGDLAVFREGSSLRHAFYDFLVLHGYPLVPAEEKSFYYIKSIPSKTWRPCIILQHSGPGSYIICPMLTASFRELDLTSVTHRMSIPIGNNQLDGLRMYPPTVSRFMLALPVKRSEPYIKPWGYSTFRSTLGYGELERARHLVQEKLEYFRSDHAALRRAQLHLLRDRDHMANKSRRKKPRFRQAPIFRLDPVRNTGKGDLPEFKYVEPHLNPCNLRWLMKHGKKDLAEASTYLSSVVDPPPRLFRLPPPVYFRSLRASAAFVRGRIFR